MSFKVWRFLIIGQEESQLHGRRLRRDIKNKADEKGIKGSVRNIKNKPEVEVRIASDNNIAKQFHSEIKSDPQMKELNIGNLFSIEGEKEEDYPDFKVMREDELTEMVWALQGAGDVFLDSSKHQKEIAEKQEEILEAIEKRDERKELSRLTPLFHELGYNLKILDFLIEDAKRGSPHVGCFRDKCLEKAVTDPPYLDGGFIESTQQIYYSFKNIESVTPTYERLVEVKEWLKEYKKSISKRMEDLTQKHGIDNFIKGK